MFSASTRRIHWDSVFPQLPSSPIAAIRPTEEQLMNGLIPIPELRASLLTALLLLHASPVMLANRLAALLEPVRRVSPLWLYVVVLEMLIGGDLVLIAPGL